MDREIVVGRSSDLDMVLVEDMVSRKHAKISATGDQIVIQDLGSTNGTFVNGEKIKKARLKEGDRILIGTSIIKLVATAGEQNTSITENEARSRLVVAGNKRPQTKSMSGSIEEIPLPDLLQLLSTSRKSGVLVIRSDLGVGKIYLRKGQIYFASIDESFNTGPRKAMYRMLAWTAGFFDLEPPDEREVIEELNDSTEGLLMEGMRQLDEYRVHAEKLPPLTATLAIPHPLEAKLRDLGPEELDVFQVALGAETVRAVFDECPLTDMTIAEKLKVLLDKGYVVASE